MSESVPIPPCHVNPHTGLAWKDDPAIVDIDRLVTGTALAWELLHESGE